MSATTNLCDVELAIARQSLYRFTALSLLDPRAGSWEQLAAVRADSRLLIEAAALLRETPQAVPARLGRGERPLAELQPAKVLALLPATPQMFNDEYERVFGLLVTSAYPPYETEYIPSKFTFQRSHALADVNGFYHAFGLATSNAHPERPDHIVQELEFMACVIGLERHACVGRATNAEERLMVCRQAQVRFMREHLAWWTPAFATLLSREAGGFFSAAADLLAALIPAERGLLHVEATDQQAAPMLVEQPDACDGCLSAT